MNDSAASTPVASRPTFAEAFRFWLKLGFISFGGPTGQIAIMHEEIVERRKWVDEGRFLHALNYCMLLPGPEAQQLAIYIGWILHGTWGGIVAGTLFVLPAALLLWVLSYVYVEFGTIASITAVFAGLKPAVLALVAAAVLRIGQKILKNEAMWLLAITAFVAIFFFKLPFPLIIAAAALVGYFGGKLWPGKFVIIKGHKEKDGATGESAFEIAAGQKPTWKRALKVCAVCLALWWAPVLLLGLWLGWQHTLIHEALFFSKAAMVTFGGAYAVLPYVAQQAVENYHWLDGVQMLDGLGLAESTPGPLIMVLQFVGFLGGWNQPGQLSPLLAATLGAGITTWVTFVPCFLWILLGAPYIERSRENTRFTAALSAVTAAVVGVVMNLAVWFGGQVLFPKLAQSWRVDGFALVVAAIAFYGLVWRKWNVIAVVLVSAAVGLAYNWLVR
ncbi:MAG: chromate efflux transporter [Pedosphaera sp.]|nr:chromate efflux transporter [Pedosphaera sp.]